MNWTLITAYGHPRETPPREDCALWITDAVLAWYFGEMG